MKWNIYFIVKELQEQKRSDRFFVCGKVFIALPGRRAVSVAHWSSSLVLIENLVILVHNFYRQPITPSFCPSLVFWLIRRRWKALPSVPAQFPISYLFSCLFLYRRFLLPLFAVFASVLPFGLSCSPFLSRGPVTSRGRVVVIGKVGTCGMGYMSLCTGRG